MGPAALARFLKCALGMVQPDPHNHSSACGSCLSPWWRHYHAEDAYHHPAAQIAAHFVYILQWFCVIIGLQKSVKCHEDCHGEDAYHHLVAQIVAHLLNILQWFAVQLVNMLQWFCVIIGLQKSVKCHEDWHQEDAYCCPVAQIVVHLVNILQWFYIIIGLHKSVKCHEDCHGEDAYCCLVAQIVAHLVNILQWL